MSITAICKSCGRRYQAPDEMAGKRVRCKQCGIVFELPPPDDASGNSDLDALAALEKSFSDVDASSMSGTAASPSPRSGSRDEDRGEPEDGAPPPLRTGRTNVRFRWTYAKEIDEYLPW